MWWSDSAVCSSDEDLLAQHLCWRSEWMQKHFHVLQKIVRYCLARGSGTVLTAMLATNQTASTERAWQESLAGLVVVVPLIERERVDYLVSGKSKRIAFSNATTFPSLI